MKLAQCFELGVVAKPHGLQGVVHAVLDTDYPEDYTELESIFLLQNGMLVPFFIEHIQINRKQALIKFEEVDSKAEAAQLKGTSLHLPLTELPELTNEQFYFHEIVGFQITDVESGALGTVGQVYEAGHQDLIGMNYQDKEVLIPINDDIIKKVDRQQKSLLVSLPDGLLALYLED